jgi:hypothetical protein
MREPLKVLAKFVDDLSKPIEKDGRQHIGYVPTQIFTEYIRHFLQAPNGESIMGIVYPSAQNEGANSCVLFLENKDCVNSNSENPDSWLKLVKVNHQSLP